MKPGRDIVLVFGKTNMGKTSWTRQYLATRRRVILLDPMDEYPGLAFQDPVKMIEHIQAHREFTVRSVAVQDFDALSLIAFSAGHVTFAIEEAQRSLPSWQKDLPPAFADIVYRGAHTGTSLVLIAQRPSTVNIAARSQFTRLVSFAQSEVADVRWIEGVTGLGIGGSILRLPPLNYIEVEQGEAVEKTLTFPRQSDRLPSLDSDSPPEAASLFDSPGGMFQ